MWDAFFARRNFYNKCQSALRMINIRMETIMKKRSAMHKFLKDDVADLLRTNLDHNAYGRAQGLYMEMNLTWCYNYVQECCTLVGDKLKEMEAKTECPEDCKVAVASLAYAAARFADLPELRDLRSLFADKYGNTLDPFVNKEFVEKLKANPPTREAKLQLMKEIAEEFSIPWDPASFGKNLQDGSTRGYKVNNNVPEHSRVQERVVYERMPSNNTRGGYVDVHQTRPYTGNVVPAPYVKLKNKNEGEDSQESDAEMDKILRHYSMKSWRKTQSDGTENSVSSHSPMYGRSVSLYTHPNLPDCDELASRIQALRKT